MTVSGGAYAAVQISDSDMNLDLATTSIESRSLEEANRSTARTGLEFVGFTLVVDGESTEVATDAVSWAGALLDEGVSVDAAAGDIVSVSLTEAPEEGATVTVSHATVTYETEEKVIEYETIEEETDTLLEGETEVDTEGVDGVSTVTYAVTSVNGEETGRTVISSVTESEKVDEVVLVGTGTEESSDDTTSTTTTSSASGTTAAGAQAIASSMMSSYGWDSSQFSCLVSLWNRESGWNYQAQNSSSGAYGIPQALPGSKMSSVASDWATNPTTQIIWGLKYIDGRYGSPCSAWAHSESVGWY